MACVNCNPDERPTMKDVATHLKEIRHDCYDYNSKVNLLLNNILHPTRLGCRILPQTPNLLQNPCQGLSLRLQQLLARSQSSSRSTHNLRVSSIPCEKMSIFLKITEIHVYKLQAVPKKVQIQMKKPFILIELVWRKGQKCWNKGRIFKSSSRPLTGSPSLFRSRVWIRW